MKQRSESIAENFLSPVTGALLIGLILVLLLVLPSSFNRAARNLDSDLLFRMRGSRTLSDKILFVFIGPEDVRELGGWPITRDYYGYLIHILRHSGARAIGLDVLFDKSGTLYPEYDAALADFVGSAGNVCLPMVFSSLAAEAESASVAGTKISGVSPVFPFNTLRKEAAGCGFSNLGPDTRLHSVPIAVSENDTLRLSFGAEIARIYLHKYGKPRIEKDALLLADSNGESVKIPLTREGGFLLNHFGGTDDVRKIGLIDLLQMYESNPDSLHLQDKAVIVGVTLPGVSSTAATPLSDLLPASLIHAAVAENIITGSILRRTSAAPNAIILAGLVLIFLLLWRYLPQRINALLFPILILTYWIVSVILFSRAHIIPGLLYPTAAMLLTGIWLFLRQGQLQRLELRNRRLLLEGNISEKETQLKEVQANFAAIQSQLADSGEQSGQVQKLAEERLQTIHQLESEIRDLQSYTGGGEISIPADFPEIIRSPQSNMNRVLEIVQRIREDDIPVLILGETGTGKEVIAREIHHNSRRHMKPFVAINCGALAENLLESELFGHEKGSFTGAHMRRRGRFELADGGTIFLDEITETTPAFQARLLRVLQEGVFERLGGEQTLRVDVRIIAATNRDLQKELELGRFRADLYYRLNGLRISLPSLRERKEDIPLLAQHFLRKYESGNIAELSNQAMEVLKNYDWPGNVRELENGIRRAAIMARGEERKMIRIKDLPAEIVQQQFSPQAESPYLPLETRILEMLQAQQFSHASITATAKALGNRDRGTITEYLRGICFETLAANDFDIERSARIIASSDDEKVIQRVCKKIEVYLSNLKPLPGKQELENFLAGQPAALPQFKNLPQKYHRALIEVIRFLRK